MVQKVMAAGVRYNRAVDACNELDIRPATLHSRLNSKTKTWSDWYRINDEDNSLIKKTKSRKIKANVKINDYKLDLNNAITELCILKIKEDKFLEYRMKRSLFDYRVIEKVKVKIIINSVRYNDLNDAIAELCTLRLKISEQ